MKSKEIALKHFARNPKLDEVHITSDKTVFHTGHQADAHAQRLKDKKVHSHKRADVYTDEMISKNEMATKSLELKAQKKAEAQKEAEAKQKAKDEASQPPTEDTPEDGAPLETKPIEGKDAEKAEPAPAKQKSNSKTDK